MGGLDAIKDDTVTIEKDGKSFDIPITELSEEDHAYIESVTTVQLKVTKGCDFFRCF